MLEQIKATHQVATIVDRGDLCGSACVVVFLAGKRRVGALTSAFYFHPVVMWRGDPGTPEAVARMKRRSQVTDDVIWRYFVRAGLSEIGFNTARTLRTHDLWQSGRDLWESKSGILTETLDNLAPREDGPIELPNGIACTTHCRG